jgi:CRP/FNR family transcriptional regulator
MCLPLGLSAPELEYIDRRLVAARRKVARAEHLFRSGDPFESVFVLWAGSFKTCLFTPEGREQVTGFQLGGDLLGLDGIDSRRHQVDAVALEDSVVCVIPYEWLQDLANEVGALRQQLHRMMSREIVRTHNVILHLGSLAAEQRLAAFLLNLSDRMQARGFSATSITLRMSREEIGSFLGLTVETVSRSFSKLQAQRLLFVRNRDLRIPDPRRLQNLLDGAERERQS